MSNQFRKPFSKLNQKKALRVLCAIKIDLEKAFDKLEWHFIREALVFFGIPEALTQVILQCISSPRLAVLHNGKPIDWISPSRCIRQGDSISPYLFIMCMEYLSLSINKAISEKRDGSHFLFVPTLPFYLTAFLRMTSPCLLKLTQDPFFPSKTSWKIFPSDPIYLSIDRNQKFSFLLTPPRILNSLQSISQAFLNLMSLANTLVSPFLGIGLAETS